MSLATRGFDDIRKVLGERPPTAGKFAAQSPAAKDQQRADEIDKSLAEMVRTPTLIAAVWVTSYLLIAFAAWAH